VAATIWKRQEEDDRVVSAGSIQKFRMKKRNSRVPDRTSNDSMEWQYRCQGHSTKKTFLRKFYVIFGPEGRHTAKTTISVSIAECPMMKGPRL
jgi:hypothetical protein